MTKKPFFSVIIPAYNRKSFLKIAINSVLSQTFSDYELIIIDDGSTDETKELASHWQKTKNSDTKVRYIYQKHQGVSAARNSGISQAKGRYICFLDSDDRFRQDKLEITNQYIKAHPKYKIFHTEEIWYRSGEYLPQKEYHKKPTGWVFENAVKLCSIGTSTVAIHTEVFKEIGLFDQELPACEDYDFWLRVTARMPICLIPEYLTIKEGGHSDQLSKKYSAMDAFRIYALKKIIKSRILSRENYEIAFLELKKKCEIYIKGALKRGKIGEVNSYKRIIEELKDKNV